MYITFSFNVHPQIKLFPFSTDFCGEHFCIRKRFCKALYFPDSVCVCLCVPVLGVIDLAS